jgi:predicted mannosyl-3-phosphoglycerate phosphatase (HAD superfamily)
MKTKKWPIAIDFDGTVVTHEYPAVGRDIGATPWLKKLNELGAAIILWTMRSDDNSTGRTSLSDAVNWYKENGIELFGINQNPEQDWTTSPKAYAKIYVDDAALGCPLVVSKIEGERPYVDWDIAGPYLVNLITE